MSARIHLIRHGRSAHIERRWINGAGLQAWKLAYELAGLHPGQRPPPDLQALAADAGLLVSSDLPRAIASAELLAQGRPYEVSPLLRELDIPLPQVRCVWLPLIAWGMVVGARAGWRRLCAVPPPPAALQQAGQAAEWLIGAAEQHGRVLAVTHAALRSHVARALASRGWNPLPGRRSYRNWSHWGFAPPAATPLPRNR